MELPHIQFRSGRARSLGVKVAIEAGPTHIIGRVCYLLAVRMAKP